MSLTQCAACATELGLSLGKKCGRCSTRYCGAECQKQHWESGGHDQLCKKIKRAGGAEQYNANIKYTEAVAVAAEACADDTKGQTCFICTEGIKRRTGEGLVSGFCACRGGSSFAHVSCLVEQAKILWAEAEENNLGYDAMTERWRRRYKCSLCEQDYHGVVSCALGWACWKTYLGRPETAEVRSFAMKLLGIGLSDAENHEDALTVIEAELSMMRRLGASETRILAAQTNLASTYGQLGRDEEALSMKRDIYSGHLKLYGAQNRHTFIPANNYATSLISLERFEEAKVLLRKTMPVARRVLGEGCEATLIIRLNYAKAFYRDTGATHDDLREAVTTLEELETTARRVLGGSYPTTVTIKASLQDAREALRARDAPEVLQTADDLAAHFEGL